MTSTQTVNFIPPATIQLLQAQLTPILVGVPADLTAEVNRTYVFDTLPAVASGQGPTNSFTITLPASPEDGASVTLIDVVGAFGGQASSNNEAAIASVDFNGKSGKGGCSDGALLPARKSSVKFTYSAILDKWVGQILNNDNQNGNNNITADDLWTGFWQSITFSPSAISQFEGATSSPLYDTNYVYIDATKFPVHMYRYRGTPDKPFVQSTNGAFDMTSFIPVEEECVFGSNIGSTLKGLVWYNDPVYGSFTGVYDYPAGSRFVLDPNNSNRAYYYASNFEDQWTFKNNNITIFEKVSSASVGGSLAPLNSMPYIKPYGSKDQQVYSFNDAVVLFDLFMSYILKNASCSRNVNLPTNQTFYANGDYYAAQDLINTVKTSGLTITTPIRKIVASSDGSYVLGAGKYLTTLFTYDKYHAVAAGSNITISGLAGDWAVMNGYYYNKVSGYDTNGSTLFYTGCVDWNGNTGSQINQENRIGLLYNSKDLPKISITGPSFGQADTDLTNATVSITHRVHSSMGYAEFMSTVTALSGLLLGAQTHTRFSTVFNTSDLSVKDSWKASGGVRINNRLRLEPATSSNYVNLGCYDSPYGFQEQFVNDPIHAVDKFQDLMDTYWADNFDGAGLDYIDYLSNPLVPLNYLDLSTVKNIYYAWDQPFTGPYANSWQPYLSQLDGTVNLSDPTLLGGSYIVPQLFPYPSSLEDLPDLRIWNSVSGDYISAQLSNPTGPMDDEAATIGTAIAGKDFVYAGLIHDKYVSALGHTGAKIGHFRNPDAAWFTLAVNGQTYRWNSVFLSEIAEPYSYIRAIPWVSMVSKFTSYLNSLDLDALILDNRGNAGGYTNVVSVLFGGNRSFYRRPMVQSGDGNSQILDPANLPDFTTSPQVIADYYATIDTEAAEASFPGCVVKGTAEKPLRLIFLQDQAAASAGDVIVWEFLGDNFDGNIGNHVQVSFIGDSDGRLLGGAGTFTIPRDFNTALSSRVLGSVQGFDVNANVNKMVALGPTSGQMYMYNRYPECSIRGMSTGATGTISSVSGNKCFANDCYNTIWQDWGHIAPTSPDRWIPVPGKAAPTPGDFTTYRDSWLEQAIREALVPI